MSPLQEYLLAADGVWWHFFYKNTYGLCFRKKAGAYFSDFEILEKDCQEDFCVTLVGNTIHLVCQGNDGSILYFCYEQAVWQKEIILKSRDQTPTPKHFALSVISGSINLFYILSYQEKMMLIHHILNRADEKPHVVDYLDPIDANFCLAPHNGTELSLCYKNANGACGLRSYRWSSKSFSPFFVIDASGNMSSPVLWVHEDDSISIAAVLCIEGIYNLVQLRREADGSLTPPTTVYLDCTRHPAHTLSARDSALVLEWLDGGSVMTSTKASEAEKWRKPTKYMRVTSGEVVLYHICQKGKTAPYYGSNHGNDIRLYGAEHLLSMPPEKTEKTGFRPEGSDALDFARMFGYKRPENDSFSPDYVTREELLKELSAIEKLLKEQEKRIKELSRWLDNHKTESIAENEADIDAILLKEHRSAKTVVTGT